MLLIIWILFGIGAAIAASNKGRSVFGWFLLGILLGPFGLLFALLISSNKDEIPPVIIAHELPPIPYSPEPEDETKVCPQCAETIKKAAKKCRYCGETFSFDQGKQEIEPKKEIKFDFTRRGS
ncbi:MAG: zinc ribbon domain-containing protein [Desulfobaccales bacterium]